MRFSVTTSDVCGEVPVGGGHNKWKGVIRECYKDAISSVVNSSQYCRWSPSLCLLLNGNLNLRPIITLKYLSESNNVAF